MADITTDALDAAFYTRLSGDATLQTLLGGAGRIFRLKAPSGTFPALIYSSQGGPDRSTLGGLRIRDLVYRFRVWDQGFSAQGAKAILARVDALLQDATLSVSGGSVLFLRRRSELPDLTEDGSGGVPYQIVGSEYAVEVIPS